jgi:hypothetical protein
MAGSSLASHTHTTARYRASLAAKLQALTGKRPVNLGQGQGKQGGDYKSFLGKAQE